MSFLTTPGYSNLIPYLKLNSVIWLTPVMCVPLKLAYFFLCVSFLNISQRFFRKIIGFVLFCFVLVLGLNSLPHATELNPWPKNIIIFLFILSSLVLFCFVFWITGIELRTSYLPGKCCAMELNPWSLSFRLLYYSELVTPIVYSPETLYRLSFMIDSWRFGNLLELSIRLGVALRWR